MGESAAKAPAQSADHRHAESVRKQLGTGAALPSTIRAAGEHALGFGLGDVRIHADATSSRLASSLYAHAFTVGTDVAFGAGKYRPGTPAGDALIAHELAHVAQQRGQGSATSAAAEANANTGAAALLGGEGWSPLGTGLRLHRCGIEGGGGGGPVAEGPAQAPPVEEVPRTDAAPGWAGVRRPGDYPHPSLFDREMRVDGDGDQAPELLVRVRVARWYRTPYTRPAAIAVEMEQISNPGHPQRVEFELTTDDHIASEPLSITVTDGHEPTAMRLDDMTWGTSNEFRLFPPESTATSTTYRAELEIQQGLGGSHAVQSRSFVFPAETAPEHTVFQAGAPSEVAPGVWTLDMAVGAYADPFRLTFLRPRPGDDTVAVTVSAVQGDRPTESATLATTASGALQVSIVGSRGPSLALDLNGDGRADLTLFDRLTAVRDLSITAAPTHPERDRDHSITGYTGSGARAGGIGVQVRGGVFHVLGLGYMSDYSAIVAAPAADQLAQQYAGGGFLEQLAAIEHVRAQMRTLALDRNLIGRPTYNAFHDLASDMISQRAGGANEEHPRTEDVRRRSAASNARLASAALAAEPGMDFWDMQYSQVGEPNPYTSNADYHSGSGFERWLDEAATALDSGNWPRAFEQWEGATVGLDAWIIFKMRERPALAAQAGQLDASLTLLMRLRELESHNPQIAHAVFYPHDPSDPVETRLTGIGVPLYYWREGDMWKIRCFIDPNDPFTKEAPANSAASRGCVPTDPQPPHALFQALDDGRFPQGWLFYTVRPSGTAPGRTGRVQMMSPLRAGDILAWIATATAVAGFIVFTGGAGSIVVTTIFAVSGAFGAASAITHMVEEARDDSLTPGELGLGVLQVIGSLAPVGAGVALEVRGAQAAVEAGTASRTAQMLAGWETAGRLLVPLTVTSMAADTIQFLVYTQQVIDGLAAIDRAGMNEGERMRAKALLLAQFAGSLAMTVLSVRGNIAQLRGHPGRVVIDVIDNVPVARVNLGPVEPAAYRTALGEALTAEARARFGDVEVRPITPEQMYARTGSRTANAAVVMEGGRPRVYVVQGTPAAALREEAVHIEQLLDRRLARLAGMLDESTLARWSTLPPARRAELFAAKLELEIDAQRRVIAQLDHSIDPTLPQAERDALFREIDDAWQNIEHLRGRFAELSGYQQALRGGGATASAEPEFLHEVPRLMSKATTAGFDVQDAWLNVTRDEFIANYKARYPNTSLSDADLAQRYDQGLRLHPATAHLRGPAAEGRVEPDVRATYRDEETRLRTDGTPRPGEQPLSLDQATRTRRDQLLAARDAARAEREAAHARIPPDEVAAAAAQYRVIQASRQIGELHGAAVVRARYPDATIDRIYPLVDGSRPGDFDLIFELRRPGAQPNEWVIELVVIEAKGGSSPLGSRMAGQVRAEQGTLAYYNSIVDVMLRGNDDMRRAAQRLVATPPDRVHYLHVKVPIDSGATSAAPVVSVREFDIRAAAPAGPSTP